MERDSIPGPPVLPQAEVSIPDPGGEHAVREEVEDDVMDISRSDLDEGELPQSRGKLSYVEDQEMTDSIDDEESYEPPNDISALQQQHDISHTADDDLSDATSTKSEIADDRPHDSSAHKHEADLPQPDDETDMQGEKQVPPLSQSSQSVGYASDSDDYEPPEPAPLVVEPTLPPQEPAALSKFSPSLSHASANNVNALVRSDTVMDLVQVRSASDVLETHSQKVCYTYNICRML